MKNSILTFFIITLSFSAYSQNNWNSSFDDFTNKQTFKLYPNPCKINKVNIDLGSDEIKEIRITNITGKQVLLQKLQLPKHKIQISLTEIPNGIYLVQINSTSNKNMVKKLIVSKN